MAKLENNTKTKDKQKTNKKARFVYLREGDLQP